MMCYLSFDLKTGVARLRCLRNQQTPENNDSDGDDDDHNYNDGDDDDDANDNDGDDDNDSYNDNDKDNRNDIDADDIDIHDDDDCLEISPVWCLLASVAPWVENLIPKAAKDKKYWSMVTFDMVQFCTCGKRCTMSVCAFCS